MSREIKFRIPHYSYGGKFVTFSYWGRLESGGFASPAFVSNATVKKPDEQYTGIKDKNGVEIYEGDVVRHFVKSEYLDKSDWETVEGKVIFSTVEGNWIVETRRHPLYGFENEIIGNIHTLDTNT